MEALSNVRPGDRLLITDHRHPDAITIVEKVTAKWVIGRRGERYRLGDGRLVGATTWDSTAAKVATEDDVLRVRAERRHRALVKELRDIAAAASQLPSDRIERALAILRGDGL